MPIFLLSSCSQPGFKIWCLYFVWGKYQTLPHQTWQVIKLGLNVCAPPSCGLSYTRICRSGLVSDSAVSRDVMICSCSTLNWSNRSSTETYVWTTCSASKQLVPHLLITTQILLPPQMPPKSGRKWQVVVQTGLRMTSFIFCTEWKDGKINSVKTQQQIKL